MLNTLTLKNPIRNIIAFSFIALLSIFAFSSTSTAAEAWQDQSIKVKGEWSIEQRADGNYLVLSDAFKTRNAPDLKFFLSKKSSGSITGDNATQDAVEFAVLKTNKGAQSYKIPANINVSDYSSVVLHCEQYSKLWAASPLK